MLPTGLRHLHRQLQQYKHLIHSWFYLDISSPFLGSSWDLCHPTRLFRCSTICWRHSQICVRNYFSFFFRHWQLMRELHFWQYIVLGHLSAFSKKIIYLICVREILWKAYDIPNRTIQVGFQYILQDEKSNRRARSSHLNRMSNKFILIFLREYRLVFRQKPVLNIHLIFTTCSSEWHIRNQRDSFNSLYIPKFYISFRHFSWNLIASDAYRLDIFFAMLQFTASLRISFCNYGTC
jgi:hypothetical protein